MMDQLIAVAEMTGSACSLRILLAEDNAVNQRVAQRMLEKMGHDVVLAANGLEAVQAAKQGQFDLIVMDLQMPEMDGLDATFASAGMDDYITKPIDAAALAARGKHKRGY